MRLVFVTPFYYPEQKFGGPPRKIHSLASGLVRVGHEAIVLTFDSASSDRHDLMVIDDVSVKYLPWVGRELWQWPRALTPVRRAIEAADVVHCYGIYNLLSPLAAREATRRAKPFVLEPLGMFPARTGNAVAKHVYNAAFTQRMANNAAALVAASESEARDLEALVRSDKIVYRRNGIDVERFRSVPANQDLRKTWQIAADAQVVVFVGRLSPIKNLEQLVLAFARLKMRSGKYEVENGNADSRSGTSESAADAKLVLVGPSEVGYDRRLRELVRREGIGDSVIFAGALYDDDQKAALGIADLFVLPSLNESFGNAAAEAVAANVPVLLTDTCGVASLIHRRAGMAVPLGIGSLADGLRQMLNPQIRDQMTARREEVKRELSWNEPIAQTVALYERVVRENSEKLRR